MRKLIKIIIVVCISVFLSCTNQNNELEKQALHIPESLVVYHSEPKQKASEYNIYINLDANCSSCIDKLKKIDQFSLDLKTDYTLIIILFAFNKGYIDFAVEEAFDDRKFNIFYDKEEVFYQKNSELSDYYFIITDNDNTILKYGNPDSIDEMQKMVNSLK